MKAYLIGGLVGSVVTATAYAILQRAFNGEWPKYFFV